MSNYHLSDSITPKQVVSDKLSVLRERKSWSKVFLILIIVTLIIVIVFNLFLGISYVEGNSMMPAIYEGDIFLFSRINQSYAAGDIILFKQSNKPEKYIKRIVAVPGDTIYIDEKYGYLMVNDKKVEEPYIYETTLPKVVGVSFPLTLQEKEYFVLGDHRSDSKDSRNFGVVYKKEIDGKSILIIRSPQKATEKSHTNKNIP